MLPVMGLSRALIAWVAVAAFASLSPTASAGAEFSLFSASTSFEPSTQVSWQRGFDASAASQDSAGPMEASVDASSVPVDARLVADPTSCSPVAHLQRDWFGGVAVQERTVEEEFLSPVGVVGEVERLVPGLGGLLMPVTALVKATVDVAAFAVWDEEFVEWNLYTDDLYVGFASLDLEAMDELGAQGWAIQGVTVYCGPASQGTTLVRDADAAAVSYTCLTCLDTPADGWVLVNLEHLDVHLAKARDYQAIPPGSVCACPAEVVRAVQEEVAQKLAPTYADAIRQLVERRA
jgi:hypothetical protein